MRVKFSFPYRSQAGAGVLPEIILMMFFWEMKKTMIFVKPIEDLYDDKISK